jgi:PEP-CTERM motif-containing protein
VPVSSFRLNPSVIRSPLMILTLLTLGATSAPLFAAPITDAVNDFLPGFNGPHNGDLDVLSAEVFFDGTNFTFRSTENGAIGTTAGSLFVWGVDRGLHNPFFGSFRDGVLFDVVVVLRPDLTGTVIDFSPDHDPTQDLAPGSVTVDGNTIQGVVPASMLPSKGLLPVDYQMNLWPRIGLNALDNSQISDFAPDNKDFGATAPEPSSMLFLGGGLIALGLSRRLIARFREV